MCRVGSEFLLERFCAICCERKHVKHIKIRVKSSSHFFIEILDEQKGFVITYENVVSLEFLIYLLEGQQVTIYVVCAERLINRLSLCDDVGCSP